MKNYQREYPLFSLCGLNCALCPMHLNAPAAAAERETSPAPYSAAAGNTAVRNIVFSAVSIPVKNMTV